MTQRSVVFRECDRCGKDLPLRQDGYGNSKASKGVQLVNPISYAELDLCEDCETMVVTVLAEPVKSMWHNGGPLSTANSDREAVREKTK